MYCRYCGTKLDDGAVFCPNCGAPLIVPNQTNGGQYTPPQNNQPGQNAPYNNRGANGNGEVSNVFGLVGFILSLTALVAGYFIQVYAFVALAFAIVGMVKRKSSTKYNGLAIAGLVISIVTSVIWGLYGLVSCINNIGVIRNLFFPNW